MSGHTWLILGAGSSVARAFAREAARQGADIILAARDLEDTEATAADIRARTGRQVGVLAFDARAYEEHEPFVGRCAELAAARLDVFLAFGDMPEQDAMESDFQLARRCIETNYLGAVSVLDHLAPVLAGRGGGAIVALSSVAGDRGRPKNFIYGSAKAGLSAFLEGLRGRWLRQGITVTTVKPGFLDTAMTFGLKLPLMASPAACAQACLSHGARGTEVVYFPWFWWAIMAIIKAIPARIFKRLNL